MRVDEQTLDDLDIFRRSGAIGGLFDHLDRTRTRGGREALRRRFRNPLADVRDIRNVQQSIQFITAHREHFGYLPGPQAVSELIRYVDSSSAPLLWSSGPTAAVVQAVWSRITEPAMFKEAAAGVRKVAAVADAVRRFSTTFGR